ncbi:hypothetical protein AOLI_G00258660 [Acnodon oligacanthus]
MVSDGSREKQRFTDLRFLYNFSHIRRWPNELFQQGYATTSVKFKRLGKDNSWTLKSHQQTVKFNKFKLLRPSRDLGTFLHIASYKLPRLIAEAERDDPEHTVSESINTR